MDLWQRVRAHYTGLLAVMGRRESLRGALDIDNNVGTRDTPAHAPTSLYQDQPLSSPRRRKPLWQDPSVLTMAGLLGLVTAAAFYLEGPEGVLRGLVGTWDLLLGAAPLIAMGIALAGMLQVLVPPNLVGRWMGDEAGLAGLSIGMLAGALTPGGPFVMFPIAAALMQGGAGIGPMAGYVAARNIITLNRFLVWELPFLGAPFSFARVIVSIPMVPVAAVLVPIVYHLLPGGKNAPMSRSRRESRRLEDEA